MWLKLKVSLWLYIKKGFEFKPEFLQCGTHCFGKSDFEMIIWYVLRLPTCVIKINWCITTGLCRFWLKQWLSGLTSLSCVEKMITIFTCNALRLRAAIDFALSLILFRNLMVNHQWKTCKSLLIEKFYHFKPETWTTNWNCWGRKLLLTEQGNWAADDENCRYLNPSGWKFLNYS